MDQPYPLRNEFLCTMRIKVIDSYIMEDIPAGIRRRIDILGDGEILGPKLNGIILPGGADALLTRKDGSLTPDVRLVARTDDDAMIFIQYRGVRHGNPETMERIAAGEQVSPNDYYLRNAPFFETGSKKYDWLNHILSIGVGRREPDSAVYDVYQIL